jgi:hypothetical protein
MAWVNSGLQAEMDIVGRLKEVQTRERVFRVRDETGRFRFMAGGACYPCSFGAQDR